jgi:hypothetical protein
MALSPTQRSLRARIAAHAMHAAGRTNTGPASAAFLRRFEREVDPEGKLPPDVRARRAEHALAAHMASLSLKASQARARKNAPAVEKPGAFEEGRRRDRADDPRAA